MLSVLCWMITAIAAPTLSWQGRLLGANGAPLDGPVTLQVAVFDAASGGNSLWAETISATAEGGYVSATLGASAALPDSLLLTDAGRWLQISVSGTPLSREPLRAVGYAVASRHTLGVQVRPETTPCAPGELNFTSNRLRVCTGAAWVDVDGALPTSPTFTSVTTGTLTATTTGAGALTATSVNTGSLTVTDSVTLSQPAANNIATTSFDFISALAQLQAQAVCVAINGVSTSAGDATYAVPRECVSGSTTNCNTICGNNSDPQDPTYTCFDALHIYNNVPTGAVNVDGFKTRRYFGCTSTGCGPNFCCCRG